MITVFVEDFKFKTIIGLLAFERVKRQKIRVDMGFKADEFIDYTFVCEHTRNEFEKMKFKKVEEALQYFKNNFKEIFPSLEYFYIKISKLKIISNATVGAKIEQLY